MHKARKGRDGGKMEIDKFTVERPKHKETDSYIPASSTPTGRTA